MKTRRAIVASLTLTVFLVVASPQELVAGQEAFLVEFRSLATLVTRESTIGSGMPQTSS